MAQLYGTLVTVPATATAAGKAVSTLISTFPTSLVESVLLQAPASGNTGNIYVGTATMTDSATAAAFITNAKELSLSGGPGRHVDLSKVYLLGTANDLVYVSVLL